MDDLHKFQGTDHFTLKVPEYSNFITTGSSQMKFNVNFVNIHTMISQSDLDALIVRLWALYQFITSRCQKSIFAVIDPFRFNTTWLETADCRATIIEFLSNTV
jgi:hypothetical protein